MTPVFLTGDLARHRRGRILREAVGATMADGPEAPRSGLVMMFGTEFQDAPDEGQQAWAGWADDGGRCLLLVPPFRPGENARPRPWRVHPVPGGPSAATAPPLQAALAPEVRFHLSGGLQPAEHLGGVWADGTLNTGYFRRHPRAGLFTVTCLPLWSIASLEQKDALGRWLEGLIELAGPAAPPAEAAPTFLPGPDHLALLLHLATADFPTADAAIGGLAGSPYFRLDPRAAGRHLEELQAAGLAAGGAATPAGKALLREGPYAAYLEALEARP